MKIERAVGELSTSNYIMCARRWWKLNVFLHNRGSWRGKMGAGICLFQRLGNGILCTGTGIHENKKQLKNGNGISIWATQAGIVGFELGFEKKNNFLGNGIRTPLHDPHNKVEVLRWIALDASANEPCGFPLWPCCKIEEQLAKDQPETTPGFGETYQWTLQYSFPLMPGEGRLAVRFA